MKIIEYALTSTDIRLTRAITTSSGSMGDRGGVRLTLRTDADTMGRGETAPVPGRPTSGTLEQLAGQRDEWARLVTGRDLDEVASELDTHALAPAARFAAHTALVDIKCQRAEVPLHQWFRTGCEPTVHVNALVSADTPAEVHREVAHAVADGFRAVKLKVGAHETARDTTRIIAASEAAGPRIELRLDANKGWSADDVRHIVGRVGRHRLAYIEDPTPDPTEYAALADETGVDMALDAPPESANDLSGLVARTGVQAMVVKPAAAGGTDRILDLARAVGDSCRVIVSSSIDSEIALRAGLHAAAALPGPPIAHGLGTASLVRGVSRDLVPQDGTIRLPSTPGVGAAVEIG